MNSVRRSNVRPALGAVLLALILFGLTPCAAFAQKVDGRALATGGQGNVPPCAQCHGANGEGTPGAAFPRLAGQGQAYLAKQLRDFRDGKRANPVMQPIARLLDENAITAVSEYYARLADVQRPADNAPAQADARLGLKLAAGGDWDHDIPSCAACHGERLNGIAPHFPALAAQNAQYTAKQLRDFRSGARSNDPLGLMKSVATRMTDAQIEAVSAYLAGATPNVARR